MLKVLKLTTADAIEAERMATCALITVVILSFAHNLAYGAVQPPLLPPPPSTVPPPPFQPFAPPPPSSPEPSCSVAIPSQFILGPDGNILLLACGCFVEEGDICGCDDACRANGDCCANYEV